MVISAHFEGASDVVGKPRGRRRKLCLEVQGSLPSGGTARVLVHNISATGLLLECQLSLAIDEAIEIDLPHAGAIRAKVIWASGNFFGCQFGSAVSPAALSAAQLRSGSMEALPVAEDASGPDESFGLRLQRLRKDRGFTLAQIASELGVSKPTVWAWEQGKARPIDSRIDVLASFLGVPRSELLSSRNLSGLRDLLARSREEIARAAGTSPENIRIMIEL